MECGEGGQTAVRRGQCCLRCCRRLRRQPISSLLECTPKSNPAATTICGLKILNCWNLKTDFSAHPTKARKTTRERRKEKSSQAGERAGERKRESRSETRSNCRRDSRQLGQGTNLWPCLPLGLGPLQRRSEDWDSDSDAHSVSRTENETESETATETTGPGPGWEPAPASLQA